MSRFSSDAVGKVRRSSHPQPSAYCLCLRTASSKLLSLHRHQAPKSPTVSVRVRSTLLPQQLVPVEGRPPIGARACTRGKDLVSCWQSSSEKKPGAHRTVRKSYVRNRYAGLRHLTASLAPGAYVASTRRLLRSMRLARPSCLCGLTSHGRWWLLRGEDRGRN